MGAGLARQIRVRYPEHYADFKLWRQTHKHKHDGAIGTLVITTHYAPLYIVGMCAQRDYGRDPTVEYTRYDEFQTCLREVDYLCLKYEKKLYIPYKIGCGLAGGNWQHILYYIKEHTPYAIICKLGKPTEGEKARLKRDGKIYL
jgi:hypothetical protein